jgi:hypothetical protein
MREYEIGKRPSGNAAEKSVVRRKGKILAEREGF